MVYEVMSPFLSGRTGKSQERKAVREDVANTLKFCGTPLGAKDNHYDILATPTKRHPYLLEVS